MSRQSNAKEDQGYVSKQPSRTCGNCANFLSDVEKSEFFGYRTEKNLHCGIGRFVVKKMGTCRLFAEATNA